MVVFELNVVAAVLFTDISSTPRQNSYLSLRLRKAVLYVYVCTCVQPVDKVGRAAMQHARPHSAPGIRPESSMAFVGEHAGPGPFPTVLAFILASLGQLKRR